MKGLAEQLQAFVDPFDLDVFLPHILSNLDRQLQRSAVSFSCLKAEHILWWYSRGLPWGYKTGLKPVNSLRYNGFLCPRTVCGYKYCCVLQVLLGLLLALKGPIQLSGSHRVPSGSAQEKHVVIPLVPSMVRLPTLPISSPAPQPLAKHAQVCL